MPEPVQYMMQRTVRLLQNPEHPVLQRRPSIEKTTCKRSPASNILGTDAKPITNMVRQMDCQRCN